MNIATPPPAGFCIRLAALSIDGLILGVPFWFVGFTTGLSVSAQWTYTLLYVISGIAYYVGFLSSKWQATPGKRLLRIFVGNAADGRPLTYAQGVKRYLVFNLASLGITATALLAPASVFTPDMGPEEWKMRHGRMMELQGRMLQGQQLSPEEESILREEAEQMQPSGMTLIPMLGFTYMLALALSVALTREKTGLHDMFAKTRAVRGRPEEVFT